MMNNMMVCSTITRPKGLENQKNETFNIIKLHSIKRSVINPMLFKTNKQKNQNKNQKPTGKDTKKSIL